ncbi:MAG: M81 family metallopeptidase [Anaerolineae bacterium]|nr:M81 family metallopeptidase [Anaerolineae bacterium]
MKVFAGGISTETNTFSPMPTGLADFDIARAADLDESGQMGGFGGPFNIFRRRCQERGWDYHFSLYASAQPAGTTVRGVYESLRDEMLEALHDALPVDIVLLPLHGAMVAEGYDDCETDIATRAREIVGPSAKIGIELDLHCDLTQELIDAVDAIVIFKEYPHTDINERAEELFAIIADAAEGKTRPTMALYDCRMIGLFLTPFEPMRGFVDDMSAREAEPGVLSLSLAHCFPWADVPSCGAQMLAISDDDPALAANLAQEFGRRFFAMRHALDPPSLSLDAALDKALAADAGPVVVADQADNAGGGAPSDSTFVLRALLERGVTNAALGMIWDPVAVTVVMSAGAGATLDLRLGGKMGPMSGDPLDLRVIVSGIIADMKQQWTQSDGAVSVDCGDAVRLHCQGIDIIVNSIRRQVFSPTVFSNFGIDPASKRLLVVKSTQHFYAGFATPEVGASEIIYMAGPGAVAPRFREIPYQRADLRKYPWLDDPFAN